MYYWNMGLGFKSANLRGEKSSEKSSENDWFRSVIDLPQTAISAINLKNWNAEPAVVHMVALAGPAARCNVMEGDVILAVDGHTATSENVLSLLRTSRNAKDGQVDASRGKDGQGNDGACSGAGRGGGCGGNGVALSSVLSIQRGKQRMEVEVVRTGAEDVKRVQLVLSLVDSLAAFVDESRVSHVCEPIQPFKEGLGPLVGLKQTIINNERERQTEEHRHAQRLHEIHHKVVNLINDAAQSLFAPAPPLPDLSVWNSCNVRLLSRLRSQKACR